MPIPPSERVHHGFMPGEAAGAADKAVRRPSRCIPWGGLNAPVTVPGGLNVKASNQAGNTLNNGQQTDTYTLGLVDELLFKDRCFRRGQGPLVICCCP